MQLLLIGLAFLLGCVAAGLLFAGIWRHTATDGARAHEGQLSAQRRLGAARRELSIVQAQLVRTRSTLVAAERRGARSRSTLARVERSDGALRRALVQRLQTLAATAGTLAHQNAALQSELRAFDAYVRNPGAAGMDSGYLLSQVHYLESSAQTAAAAAATLARDTAAAASTTR
jgi:hypothetical protein